MWSGTNTTLKKQVQYKTCKSKKAYMVLMINKHYERASKPVIQDIYMLDREKGETSVPK